MKIKLLLLAGAFSASSACGALAEPITYKFTVQGPGAGPVPGFTGTLDGVPIGGGDDVITFTFTADTSTVTPFLITGAYGFTNSVGTGSFSIVDQDTMELVAGGTFLPHDGIFVSIDNKNGGVGFGSNFNSGAGFPGDAAYPLGIQFSTATTYVDFQDPIGVFGTASLSCAGFPGACMAPPALATTDGELVIGGATGQFFSNEGSFVEEITSGGSSPPPSAPVPEPSTWAMLLLGFAGVGYVRRQGVSRDWGGGDGNEMIGRAAAGREIMDGVGIALGRNPHAQRRRAGDQPARGSMQSSGVLRRLG